MPSGVVRNAEEEKDWERAKGIIREQYPDKEEQDKEGFYALVTTVFKSIRKGHGDERWESFKGWEALLQESKRSIVNAGRFTSYKNLRTEDRVVVTTLLGKVLSEGIVQAVNKGSITLRVSRGAQPTDTVYEHALSRYVLLTLTEADERRQKLREWFDGDVDLEDIPGNKPAPEIQTIMDTLSWIEGVYEASVLWGDIIKRGFDAAMKLHNIEPDAAYSLHKALYKGSSMDYKPKKR